MKNISLKMTKTISLVCLVGILGSSLALASAPSAARLPKSWYQLPEASPAPQSSLLRQSLSSVRAAEASDLDELSPVVDKILDVNAMGLNAVVMPPFATEPPAANRPKDWAPWHLEYFTTDLSFSASGLIGLLVGKGTPAIQMFWRRQGQANGMKPTTAQLAAVRAIETPANDTIQVTDESTPADIARQIEPVVQAVAASGKIQNIANLRASVQQSAQEFQQFVQAIKTQEATSWWVSGFRVDFVLDMQGNALPIGSLGGEARLRFEWKRLQHTQASTPTPVPPTTPPGGNPIPTPIPFRVANSDASPFQESLKQFVNAMSEDLEAATEDCPLGLDFQASAFRVGIGMSAKGDVGFAKGTGTVIGHLNFSRDVKKPVVYPRNTNHALLNYAMIQLNPLASNLAYARQEGISINRAQVSSMGSMVDEVIFYINRERIRSGIQRSMEIGSFFAERAASVSSSQWKPHTLKAGFDLSLTGTVGLVSLGGLATTEISFYNQKF